MLPTHLTSSTDGLCGLSADYTPGTKRVKCGEATLVFYALLPVTTQWLKTHSLAHSSFDHKSGHGTSGFSAQDLIKIKASPCSHLELSILFQAVCDR